MSLHSVFEIEEADIVRLIPDLGDGGSASGWVNVGVHSLRIELNDGGDLIVNSYARGNEASETAHTLIAHKSTAVAQGGVDPDFDPVDDELAGFDGSTGYAITYNCPHCDHTWHENWSCACDSTCPGCGAQDIEAHDFALDGTMSQEALDRYNGLTDSD